MFCGKEKARIQALEAELAQAQAFASALDRSNAMIVAVSIGVGMVPLIAPNFRQWMPHAIHPLIESGILLASITAVALNVFFNGASRDTSAAVNAARQADAH